jgi:hypothetical protein
MGFTSEEIDGKVAVGVTEDRPPYGGKTSVLGIIGRLSRMAELSSTTRLSQYAKKDRVLSVSGRNGWRQGIFFGRGVLRSFR